MNLTKTYFPDAVISVGWTTRYNFQSEFKIELFCLYLLLTNLTSLRYGPDVTSWPLQIINEGSYTMNHMIQLRDALIEADIQQPVTFPIRAGMSTSVESQESIRWLLNQVNALKRGALYPTANIAISITRSFCDLSKPPIKHRERLFC